MTEARRLAQSPGGPPDKGQGMASKQYEAATAAVMAAMEGWTQREIAEGLGISQPFVHEIITGKKLPSPEMLEKLAHLAGGSIVIEFRRDSRGKSRRK